MKSFSSFPFYPISLSNSPSTPLLSPSLSLSFTSLSPPSPPSLSLNSPHLSPLSPLCYHTPVSHLPPQSPHLSPLRDGARGGERGEIGGRGERGEKDLLIFLFKPEDTQTLIMEWPLSYEKGSAGEKMRLAECIRMTVNGFFTHVWFTATSPSHS